jgi:hypothetical protein
MIDQTFPNLLGPKELIHERQFTHIDYIQRDREILVHMGKRVCAILGTNLASLQQGLPIEFDEPDGRSHRCLIPRPKELLESKYLFFVGFFGQKRDELPSNYFSTLDDRLVEQIPIYPEIFSYSTMALKNGDFSNLVLLSNEEIKLKWMDGEIHKHAVDRSPGYYRSIRISNGVLPEGILQNDSLQINQVKYYDYREDPPWKALRKLTQ